MPCYSTLFCVCICTASCWWWCAWWCLCQYHRCQVMLACDQISPSNLFPSPAPPTLSTHTSCLCIRQEGSCFHEVPLEWKKHFPPCLFLTGERGRGNRSLQILKHISHNCFRGNETSESLINHGQLICPASGRSRNWTQISPIFFNFLKQEPAYFFFFLTQHHIRFPQLFSFLKPTPFFGCIWVFPDCFSFSFTSYYFFVLFYFVLLFSLLPVTFFFAPLLYWSSQSDLQRQSHEISSVVALTGHCWASLSFTDKIFKSSCNSFQCIGQCCYLCVLTVVSNTQVT